ncbi:MAG: hypothetical protein ABI626_02125 [Sphingomicrobium sp.]
MTYGDDADAVFSTVFVAPTNGFLRFDGIATLATVVVDGQPVAESSSMWLPLDIAVAAGEHRIDVHCRALADELAIARKPRARWRQKVAYDNNLRWFRTSLLGRAPGFAPGPPIVGLWRPVWFVADEPNFQVRARLVDGVGVVNVTSSLPDGAVVTVGDSRGEFCGGRAVVEVISPRRWWPHTHGDPYLYDVNVDGYGTVRRVGFRSIGASDDILRDGLRPTINDVKLFVRGAVWTPVPDDQLRSTLETARDYGLNAVRLAGTMTYETAHFHDLCDELGMLVWQDLMFANFDYPFSDPEFHHLVEQELDAVVSMIGGRPSTFCVCGNSEVEQQAAMLGLPPFLARAPFFYDEIPSALELADVDALYVPSAPCGADRPMIPSQGVSNWFGVGGYRQPLSTVRAAGVRFASECLAIANIGDDVSNLDIANWKVGVARDVGADWDFDDVRNHYLELLYDVDCDHMRGTDPERWLDLSRHVSGDVMSEVFGEWRRKDSGSHGGFILWLRDLVPGAGWGLMDSAGNPKQAFRALRKVLAPLAVWMTDEGLDGYAVHVANDRPRPFSGKLLVQASIGGRMLYDGETAVEVAAHDVWTGDVETILGQWIDVAFTYHFGPPAHDLVTAQLLDEDSALIGDARRFPMGRGRVS